MSHYNVNVSVPKTLIPTSHPLVASSNNSDDAPSRRPTSILETEISPELIPHATETQAAPAQNTAKAIGTYELQDFNLYFLTRYGFRPSKVAYLALQAWKTRTAAPGLICSRQISAVSTT